MAELLLKGIDNVGSVDQAYKKGDVVDVFADGGAVGTRIVPPNFSVLVVLDTDAEDARFYREPWSFVTLFQTIQEEPITDSARISMSQETPGNSNQFPMTREKAEPEFNWWGGVYANELENDIRFDITVQQIYTSNGFWRRRDPDEIGPLPIGIVETDYNQTTRTHTAEITNDEAVWSWIDVRDRVEYQGGTLSTPVGNKAEMIITKDAATAAMQKDVYAALYETLVVRRYYIDPVAVNVIQTLPDNTLTLTPEQAALQILDKADV